MATTHSYTPDAHRLAASLPAIYAEHPAAEGLATARRITVTAADLIRAAGSVALDASVINTAALLHLAGPVDGHNRARASAAIAAAWLRGSDAPAEYVQAVCAAIVAAWNEAAWNGVEDGDSHQNGAEIPDADGDDNGRLLWNAARLDLVTVDRHADVLRATPAAGRERERHLSHYRRRYLMPALSLGEQLTTVSAVEIYNQRLPRLAAWLDDRDASLVPADWRRLTEVAVIQTGVARLLAGEDPALVRSEMPPPGLPYAEYRGQQRSVICRQPRPHPGPHPRPHRSVAQRGRRKVPGKRHHPQAGGGRKPVRRRPSARPPTGSVGGGLPRTSPACCCPMPAPSRNAR